MSDLFRSKRKLGIVISAVFMVLTLAAGGIAWLLLGGGVEGVAAAAPNPPEIEYQPPLRDEVYHSEYIPQYIPRVIPEHSFPDEMRGVYLVPGEDFLTDINASAENIRAEIDRALSDAVNLTMNTIIVPTNLDGQAIFSSINAPQISAGFDVMEHIATGARERGLFLYAIFDASVFLDGGGVGAGELSRLADNLRDFAVRYNPNGILLTGYTRETDQTAFGSYLRLGGGIGFENYLRLSPASVMGTASRTIRNYAPNVKIGLLADPVWENSSINPEGSNTVAAFTALGSGNADTRAFVLDGLVDFIAVEAFGSLSDPNLPFGEVAGWWGQLASESGIPLYIVHAADNIAAAPDQLVQQVIHASGVSGYSGSIFNSLRRLVENPSGATATLVRYYQGQVQTQHILTELEIVSPAQTSFTTHEPHVTFSGASDPNFPLTVNGREITTTDVNGYFTISLELAAGGNVFVFEHKGRTITYSITRNIEILREIAPTGNIATDGNMTLSISALAYENATVSAVINGVRIPMQIDEGAEDEMARVSHFRRFVGTFTTPTGTENEQTLGTITINASWNGHNESMVGAAVRVNRRVPVSDGLPIVVIADQARTYPPNTLNNIPDANFFPLPRGAMDYAVGDEITYTSRRGNTYRYRVLASGLRVLSSSIQATSDFVGNNTISGINVSTQGRFTYLTVNTAQPVTYSIRYTGAAFIIDFNNTTNAPEGSAALGSNPMFTNASWSGSTLTLTLARNGGFMGFRAYYDAGGNLNFRFNTPPTSLNGARIAIDVGHGGGDPGALGFLQAYNEAVINGLITDHLVNELRARGANVLRIDNSSNPSLQSRVAQAEAFDADVFISVHNNASTNPSARGTETFYFYSYGRPAAAAISRHVSAALGTVNRGAQQSFYHVTLSSQFPSVLIEAGFMTNPSEYEKLIQPGYQRAIAIGIADGLAEGIAAASTGITATGSQTVGTATPAVDAPPPAVEEAVQVEDEEEIADYDTPDIEDVYFYDEYVFLTVGERLALEFAAYPYDADTSGITFSSSNSSAVSVDSQGRVYASQAGTAIITMRAGSLSSRLTVEVYSDEWE